MTNKRNGTLYVGVTNNLPQRVWQHRNNLLDGFTKRYELNRLVHYECYPSISDAIAREKQLKNWRRTWKLELIERQNPRWVDLYDELI